MENIFIRPYNEYKRDFDYVKLWLEQCTTYAKIQDRNLNVEHFQNWVKKNIKKDGQFPIFNPRMRMLIKDENNDRQKSTTTMLEYLKDVVQLDLKFTPTFTTYRPEHYMRSVEASFLNIGMANRSKEKKLKFEAMERGDEVLAEYHDNMQKRLKVLNNSSSGAKAVASTILYNASGHSVLTSICRSTTSFSNAINEKLLGGFRHYYNPEVTINNILSTLTYIDLPKTQKTIDKFSLHYITRDELINEIKRSTLLYWDAPKIFKQIEDVVDKLTPLERTAYLYNSDLFMLRKYNDGFIRNLFGKLLKKDIPPLPMEEAEYYVSIMDGDLAALIVIYVSDLCHIDGKGLSIHTAMKKRPEIIPQVGAVIKNTIEAFEEIRDVIQDFFVTEIMPFETASVPDMMRGVVLGSDTDSSLFTADEWVNWYYGIIEHTEEARSLVATLVYITSQHIAHILGMMTGIINIIDEKKALIAMKNEFLFSSFTTTSRGKHYYAKKEAQEGILIPSEKMDTEIKGVALKHTKVPKHITEMFKQELYGVMNTIERDEQYSILELRKRIALLEHEVYQSIKSGSPDYLARGQVKVKEAYKNENSLYKRGYEFWEYVFAPKYGHTVEPPYDCVKVATGINTRQKMMTWLSLFEDKELALRMMTWIDEHNEGKPLKTFYVPQAVVSSVGMPIELMMVMQTRKLAYAITAPWYLLQESFNIYEINPKHHTRLCSDDFPELQVPPALFDDDED